MWHSFARSIQLGCALSCLVVSMAGAQLSIEGSTFGVPDSCVDGRCADYAIVAAPGSVVCLNFSACLDMQVSCDQLVTVTGQTYAPPGLVCGTTDAAGTFVFRVQGAGKSTTLSLPSPLQSPGTPFGVACVAYTVGGVLTGTLTVRAYDINGAGSPTAAVNSADAATVLAENLRGTNTGVRYERTNMDANTVVNTADVSLMLAMANDAALGRGSRVTGPYCP